MKIQTLFVRDIFRPINGVVKADQLDDSSVWQELDEFVVGVPVLGRRFAAEFRPRGANLKRREAALVRV